MTDENTGGGWFIVWKRGIKRIRKMVERRRWSDTITVFVALCETENNITNELADRWFYHSLKQQMNETGLSKPTINSINRELARIGMIEIKHGHKTHGRHAIKSREHYNFFRIVNR